MSIRKDIWNTEENAKAYDAYAQKFSMYKQTSADLVAIAGIKEGMTIVDLAAGTGATTEAILTKIGDKAEIILVDQAEEMLKKAKERFVGKNSAERNEVKFVISTAEDLDKVIIEPVDAVICNSAFWQMKAEFTFRAVSNILKVGGTFAFNLPDQFFSHPDFKNQPRKPLLYSVDDLVRWGKECGLSLAAQPIKTYSKKLDEVIAFAEIPVMRRNYKTEEDRKEHLARLSASATQDSTWNGQWAYFVFKKK